MNGVKLTGTKVAAADFLGILLDHGLFGAVVVFFIIRLQQ